MKPLYGALGFGMGLAYSAWAVGYMGIDWSFMAGVGVALGLLNGIVVPMFVVRR